MLQRGSSSCTGSKNIEPTSGNGLCVCVCVRAVWVKQSQSPADLMYLLLLAWIRSVSATEVVTHKAHAQKNLCNSGLSNRVSASRSCLASPGLWQKCKGVD